MASLDDAMAEFGMPSDDGGLTTVDVLTQYRVGRRDFSDASIEEPAGVHPLRGATLERADFSRAFIVADFGGCRLRGSTFAGANVKTCRFDGADLRDADFRGAALDAATFDGALVEGASFAGATIQGHTFADGETPSS